MSTLENIATDKYLLVVDSGSEVRCGDIYWDEELQSICQRSDDSEFYCNWWKKIVFAYEKK